MEQIYGSWVEYRLQQGAEEEERSNGMWLESFPIPYMG